MHPNGKIVFRAINNKYEVCEKGNYEHNKGLKQTTNDFDSDSHTKGIATITGEQGLRLDDKDGNSITFDPTLGTINITSPASVNITAAEIKLRAALIYLNKQVIK